MQSCEMTRDWLFVDDDITHVTNKIVSTLAITRSDAELTILCWRHIPCGDFVSFYKMMSNTQNANVMIVVSPGTNIAKVETVLLNDIRGFFGNNWDTGRKHTNKFYLLSLCSNAYLLMEFKLLDISGEYFIREIYRSLVPRALQRRERNVMTMKHIYRH